jgi:hypothetical protein
MSIYILRTVLENDNHLYLKKIPIFKVNSDGTLKAKATSPLTTEE